jgi:hypothetical protein
MGEQGFVVRARVLQVEDLELLSLRGDQRLDPGEEPKGFFLSDAGFRGVHDFVHARTGGPKEPLGILARRSAPSEVHPIDVLGHRLTSLE